MVAQQVKAVNSLTRCACPILNCPSPTLNWGGGLLGCLGNTNSWLLGSSSPLVLRLYKAVLCFSWWFVDLQLKQIHYERNSNVTSVFLANTCVKC